MNAPPSTPGTALLVGGNALLVFLVVAGELRLGDVLVLFWLEHAVGAAVCIVKILTSTAVAPDPPGSAWERMDPATKESATVFARWLFAAVVGFWALLTTTIYGAFVAELASDHGMAGSWWTLLLTAAALGGHHVVDLSRVWFGTGQRHQVLPGAVAKGPFLRMIVLHVGLVTISMVLAAAGPSPGVVTGLVAALCAGKTVADLAARRAPSATS